MVSHGLTDIPLTEINKKKAVKDLTVAEVVITRVLAMEAIYKGLKSLGLGKLLRSYPTLIAPKIFPSIEEAVIHVDQKKKNRHVQEPGETYDQYRTALRKLAEGCNLEAINPEEILRDCLLFGIRDNKVRERLLREMSFTLLKTDEI